ncbi:hypothetical protein H696_00747 [Fonticula alba]|uniref:ABC transporter domain-containing protein n=1 Tax=Fonticula alba TaxID=691883 RepID=A0A058ZFR9_FONAL|nr:hypothetical protein H696_00747 [Fonticula alba]KCV73204.1 hypothetical protein H696_00747 [Fonticula alba]|eukprot:XP_009492905.1 hypothetical protein H696_00747 [Fonticula alba]
MPHEDDFDTRSPLLESSAGRGTAPGGLTGTVAAAFNSAQVAVSQVVSSVANSPALLGTGYQPVPGGSAGEAAPMDGAMRFARPQQQQQQQQQHQHQHQQPATGVTSPRILSHLMPSPHMLALQHQQHHAVVDPNDPHDPSTVLVHALSPQVVPLGGAGMLSPSLTAVSSIPVGAGAPSQSARPAGVIPYNPSHMHSHFHSEVESYATGPVGLHSSFGTTASPAMTSGPRSTFLSAQASPMLAAPSPRVSTLKELKPQMQSSASLAAQADAAFKNGGLSLGFDSISFRVREPSGKKKAILTNVSGFIDSGRTCAIMGGSGCGKTSLLSVLSGMNTSRHIQGQLYLDGQPVSAKTVRMVSAYVLQDDRLLPRLTVQETILFAAKLRLPFGMSEKEKKSRVRV